MVKQPKLHPGERRIRFLETSGTIQSLTLHRIPEDLKRESLFYAL